MNCKLFRDEIEESESGQPLSQNASAHVESCPNCMAFRDERLALRQMIGSLEVVAAPGDFDFRLRARLAAIKSREPGHVAWNRFAPSGWAVALAASFVILIAFGVVIRQFLFAPKTDSDFPSIVKVSPQSAVAPVGLLHVSGANDGSDLTPSDAPRSQETISIRSTSPNKVIDANPRETVNRVNPDESGGSVDSAVSTAANVMPPGISDPTLYPSVVAVPVRASMQATTITLAGGSTKPQTISLLPVTFGGQEAFEQSSAKRVFVPLVQGVW